MSAVIRCHPSADVADRDRVNTQGGMPVMNLMHRVGAGLILVGGILPTQIEAQWPLGGCNSCGTPAAMAPMFGPVMGQPTCGQQSWMPRQRARDSRPWIYRSHTRTRISGPSMFGDATMGLPMGDCGCSQPAMMMPQAVIQPQQIITYRDVPKTIMRQEAVQVQVPMTTYKQVTMDEGGYQQVWVPRMVTKNVPQTVMQTQVQYRQVPQTVLERVPQVTTQWVPQQTVQQVAAPVCGQSLAFGSSPYPIATPTTVSPLPEYNPAPMNPVPVPTSDSATLPTPAVPKTSQIQEWQKVRQRQATIEQQKYEYEAQADLPTEPKSAGYLVPKAAGRFSSKR